jgi:PhnB protein
MSQLIPNLAFAGGDVTMPFEPTFYAKKFGMLKDRFGIRWMVHVPSAVPV